MLSLVAGALLAVGCSYLGLMIKRIYRLRTEFFNEILQYLQKLKSEIVYLRTPITKFTDLFCEERTSIAANYLKSINECLKSGNRVAIKYLSCSQITKSSLKELNDFFFVLGTNDISSELRYIDAQIVNVTEQIKRSEQSYKNEGGMYFKLSVVGGLALMLIVV